MTDQIGGPFDVSHMLIQLQSLFSHKDSFHPGDNAVLRGDRPNHLVPTGTLSLPLRARLQELDSSLPLGKGLSQVVKQLRAPSSRLGVQAGLQNLCLHRNTKLQFPNKRFFLESKPGTQSLQKGVPRFHLLHAPFPHALMVYQRKIRQILLCSVGTSKPGGRRNNSWSSSSTARRSCARLEGVPSLSGHCCLLGCFGGFKDLFFRFVPSLFLKIHSSQHRSNELLIHCHHLSLLTKHFHHETRHGFWTKNWRPCRRAARSSCLRTLHRRHRSTCRRTCRRCCDGRLCCRLRRSRSRTLCWSERIRFRLSSSCSCAGWSWTKQVELLFCSGVRYGHVGHGFTRNALSAPLPCEKRRASSFSLHA